MVIHTNNVTNQCSFVSVIPAYNPGRIVTDIVSEVSKHVDLVIIVDDGSDAENKKYLSYCTHIDNIRLITFPFNQGKGYALIAGLKEAVKHYPNFIFTIDSDGQHNPEEIIRFKQFIATSNKSYDLLIGMRQMAMGMPLRSRIGNVFTAQLFNALFKKPIADTQSGFRVLSANFAKDVVANIFPGRYETEMRMLIYAVETNRVIGDIGIETIYFDKNKNSKFHPLKDSFRVLVPLSKYTGVAIASFLLDYTIFLLMSYLFGVYYLFSHFISRICSGTFNFFSNRYLVFRSKSKKLPEGLRYIAAVIFSLFSTAILLYCLVDIIGASRALAKPAAEFTMFLINFFILNKFVFKCKN
jgi:glycosyltransferase involved in cell wall biosynthesis